ncbi:MAG: transposase [Chitinophagaceae bacterium]|nr:transposase [Chitinophagaceae bacterium]
MSSKYKPGEDAIAHFVTFSVVGWIDVFSREIYKEIFVNSLKYCQESKGLTLHAWVIMTNHVHLIISTNTNRIEDIVRDLKKYTSKQIIKAIQENPTESRKEWMLNLFNFAGKSNSNNKQYQFWKQDYHPIELNTADKLKDRLDYLHENPVRSGLVWEPWHYKYSSAIDYYTNENGLIKIEHLQC